MKIIMNSKTQVTIIPQDYMIGRIDIRPNIGKNGDFMEIEIHTSE